MSHLFEEVQEHPRGVAFGGPFRGTIAKAPATLNDLVTVTLTQVAPSQISLTGVRLQPRDASTLPAAGDTCLVSIDDLGEAWVTAWTHTPETPPIVAGSRGGNAALASLITALASLGLITDATTA